MGGQFGELGERVEGLKSTNRCLQNSHGDVKYSIENIVNNMVTTTHGSGGC